MQASSLSRMIRDSVFMIFLDFAEASGLEEIDVDGVLESLMQGVDHKSAIPTCVSSVAYFDFTNK